MCYAVECSVCHKTTWAGCGKHIESALASVPEANRCPGWRNHQCPGVQVEVGADKSADAAVAEAAGEAKAADQGN